jgi:CelD/BcsL family acetyltransferase involved in cellulose biosynthesis
MDALTLQHGCGFEDVREEWDALGERCGNVFSTWEWATTWWEHFGRPGRLRLVVARDRDGTAVAILPLYEYRGRPLRILRLVGHGPADELGPVCAPADRPAAVAALGRAVRELRADLLLAEQVSGATALGERLRGHALGQGASPVIDLAGGDWDALMASWSRNLRKQIRQSERRLERDHGLRYRLSDGRGALAEDLGVLFGLHAACHTEDESGFIGAHRAFHEDFARVAAERGWLRLWFLEADGTPVAAELDLRYGGADASYQSGRDPAMQHPGPGIVLLAHAIREAVADGLGEFRLLRGDEAYKYRFASSDAGLETIAVPGSALARAGLAARAAAPKRLELALRRGTRV